MESSTPNPPDRAEFLRRVISHVHYIWGRRDEALAQQLIDAIGITEETPPPADIFSEADVALITYGDSIIGDGLTPLQALTKTVSEDLADAVNIVHVLPFNPYSSDRGFSVIDYREVDESLGTWDDMRELASHVDLMFDLVLNHCSAKSEWFQQFLRDEAPGNGYIKTGDPTWDLSRVVRPRSLPLLTAFDTAAGVQHVEQNAAISAEVRQAITICIGKEGSAF